MPGRLPARAGVFLDGFPLMSPAKGAAAAALLSLAAAALLTGCSGAEPRRAVLDARSQDAAGLTSGMPARGEKVCLASASGRSTGLEIAVRRALADRGYGTVFLAPEEEPPAKRCRFSLAVSVTETRIPGEMPRFITLDYRDLYTSETQRAIWRRDLAPGTPAWRRTAQCAHDDAAPANSLLGAWGDVDRVVGNLVDQLFPLVR